MREKDERRDQSETVYHLIQLEIHLLTARQSPQNIDKNTVAIKIKQLANLLVSKNMR